MDPMSPIKVEPAYDGVICTGDLPMLMPNGFEINGPIIESFCNNHGIVCPSGERYSNQRLNEDYYSLLGSNICRNRDNSFINGCVCDNGYCGPTCTCKSPVNQIIQPILLYPTSTPFQAYTLLVVRTTISKVISQNDQGCIPTNIWIQDGYGPLIPCNLSLIITPEWNWVTNGTFICPSDIPVTRIVVSSPTPLTCILSAYSLDFSPCGNHPLQYAGAFYNNEIYRSYYLYQLPQSSQFAPYGCTLTECMCDPNYSGALCGFGISSYRYESGAIRRQFCGENTDPPRGSGGLSGASQCQCNQLLGLSNSLEFITPSFYGKSCAILHAYSLLTNEWIDCFGRGIGRESIFRLGKCQFDIDDLMNDTLSTPYFNINPSIESTTTYLYQVAVNPTIIQLTPGGVGAGIWSFPVGIQLIINPLIDDIVAYCNNASFPVNITYSSDMCNAADQPRLVSSWNYSLMLESEESLESGFYPNSYILCAPSLISQSAIIYSEISYSYGGFDCSNPIDRTLADVCVILGLCQIQSCLGQTIVPHSYVLGAGYGLFEGYIPSLVFGSDHVWTIDEYNFLASLLDNQICVNDIDGSYAQEAFDGQVWDSITETWFADIPPQDSVVGLEFTNYTVTHDGSVPLIDYPFGNPYTHENALLNGDTTTMPIIQGNSMILPLGLGEIISEMNITILQSGITSVAIYSPLGIECAVLYPNTTEIDLTYTVNCGSDGFVYESELITLQRFITLFSPNQTKIDELVSAYYSFYPFQSVQILWSGSYVGSMPFNISYYYRSNVTVGGTGLFQDLKDSILINHVIPTGGVYSSGCLSISGRSLRSITYPDDYAYLQNIYFTFLAARRCSDNLQCQKFARDQTQYECVFDYDFPQSWANGDPDDYYSNAFIGEEGGCGCNEFSDPITFCSTCISGYGPNTPLDWYNYLQFSLITNTTVSTDPVPYCLYPWDDTSTRDNKICGGRGTIVNSSLSVSQSVLINVFLPANTTRRCQSVQWFNQTLTLIHDSTDYDINIIRYRNGNDLLLVIDERVFYNGVEYIVDGWKDNIMTFLNSTSLICIPLNVSPSSWYSVQFTQGIRDIQASIFNFFLAKVYFM